jgi:hypothetical protein
MIIIGVDFHPAFQQIALLDTDTGEFQENGWRIARTQRSSIGLWRPRARRCVSAWRPAGTHAGLNDCWRK